MRKRVDCVLLVPAHISLFFLANEAMAHAFLDALIGCAIGRRLWRVDDVDDVRRCRQCRLASHMLDESGLDLRKTIAREYRLKHLVAIAHHHCFVPVGLLAGEGLREQVGQLVLCIRILAQRLLERRGALT